MVAYTGNILVYLGGFSKPWHKGFPFNNPPTSNTPRIPLPRGICPPRHILHQNPGQILCITTFLDEPMTSENQERKLKHGVLVSKHVEAAKNGPDLLQVMIILTEQTLHSDFDAARFSTKKLGKHFCRVTPCIQPRSSGLL